MTRAWSRTSLRFTINLALAGVALWLVFRAIDVQELGAALSHVSRRWTALALLSVFLTVAGGVIRWRLLFYPLHRVRSWRNLTYGLLVGQTINIALPLRLGEIARVYTVSATESLAAARVFATIAVERLADLALLGAAALTLLVLTTLPEWIRASGQALAVTGGIALLGVAFIALRPDWVARGAYALSTKLPERAARWMHGHVEAGISGLSALHNVSASLQVLALSACILLLAASTNYLLFRAFALTLPPIAALFLLVVLQVGNSAVSVPGNLGVFHYVTVLALAVYGVDRETALAYAIVLYAVAILPKLVLGSLIMAVGPKEFSFRAAFSSTRAELGTGGPS